eukprot:TRINITY_DN958_c0_g2_i13.p1 TRINITY_DN958_c0_g2~~TRINITY_DN958_c0_g2_i13.p1  ORF type:complete len:152 (-),score=2.12 TRINITY_DN958_c0_g2_i13:550-1005(-)
MNYDNIHPLKSYNTVYNTLDLLIQLSLNFILFYGKFKKSHFLSCVDHYNNVYPLKPSNSIYNTLSLLIQLSLNLFLFLLKSKKGLIFSHVLIDYDRYRTSSYSTLLFLKSSQLAFIEFKGFFFLQISKISENFLCGSTTRLSSMKQQNNIT